MDSADVVYPIYEYFQTVQGEGAWAGVPALFIRLYGCDQKCPWCDSAGTWHPKWAPRSGIPRMTARRFRELVQDELRPGVEHAVITGGEPTLYDLRPLVEQLVLLGLEVHLETAGHHPIRDGDMISWVTLSPKLFDGAKEAVEETIARATEVKFIISSEEDIRRAIEWRNKWRKVADPAIWRLHPEWSQRNNDKLLTAMMQASLDGGWYLGYQWHKLWTTDGADALSGGWIQTKVPLGGDPNRGY